MNQVKKCFNCQHTSFCVLYLKTVEMAGILNANLRTNPLDESPFVYIINEIAHNCKQFKVIKGEP